MELTQQKNLVAVFADAENVAEGATKAFQSAEERFTKIETTLNQVLGNHETFMQGLEDAARELMKNDLIRVTIPAAFREKLTQYISLRELQRAAKSAAAKSEGQPNETPTKSL